MDTKAKDSGDKDQRTLSWRHPPRLRFLATNLVSLLGFMLVGIGLILLMTS